MARAVLNTIAMIPLMNAKVLSRVLRRRHRFDSLSPNVLPIATWLWLLAAVFLTNMLLIHIPSVGVAPVRSVASLFLATGISIVTMWVTGSILQSTLEEVKDAKCSSQMPAAAGLPCWLYLAAFLLPFSLRAVQQLVSGPS